MPTLFQVTNANSYNRLPGGARTPLRAPKCCFCFNVRVGTMALAGWQIAMHLIALALFLVLLLRPQMMHHYAELYGHGAIAMPQQQQQHQEAMLTNGAHASPFNVAPLDGAGAGAEGRTDFGVREKLHLYILGFKETWGSVDKDGKMQPHITLTRMFLSRRPERPELAASADGGSRSESEERPRAAMQQQPLVVKADAHSATPPPPWFKAQCGSRHRYLALGLLALSLVFACLMLHGARTRRPLLLLPYFCLQVLGYCITTVAIVSSVARFSHIKLWIAQQQYMPSKQGLLTMNPHLLALWLALAFLLVLMVKAYLMGMVWACYRHLVAEQRLHRLDSRAALQTAQMDVEAMREKPALVDLPDYEKCVSLTENDFMPPPYGEQKTVETVAPKEEKEQAGPNSQ